MNPNHYWLERVVFKLNAAFLNGTVMSKWVPDQEDPEAESRALDTLEIAGIIKSPAIFEGSLPNTYRVHALRGGWKRSDPTRQIVDFDHEKFLQFCAMNGLNPTTSGILAQLKIVDGVEPVVSIGGDSYSLKSLGGDSRPQRIVAYAYKNLGYEISLDTLQKNINLRQLQGERQNLKQIFKGNVFGEHGLLEAFTEIDKRTFLLKDRALLTPDQAAAIKKA
jgi:hypothetical protein